MSRYDTGSAYFSQRPGQAPHTARTNVDCTAIFYHLDEYYLAKRKTWSVFRPLSELPGRQFTFVVSASVT